MSGWRQLVLLALGAAALHAHTSVIHLPNSPSRVEWAVQGALSDEWEVSVTLDAAHCDIYCEIRRKPDAFGRIPGVDLLLPPVVTLRIFSNGAAQPMTAVVDPSGCAGPAAGSQCRSREREDCSVAKRPLTLSLLSQFERPGTPASGSRIRAASHSCEPNHTLFSLRI